MVAKSNIQTKIPIPSGLSEAFREELARRIVSEVQGRAARGIDRNGKAFKGYTSEYKASRDFKTAGKSSGVNLQSTGDMLAELDIISIQSSSITIGYTAGDEYAGQVEGNTIGSYGKSSGNASKARPFIGLPDKVVNRLIEEMRNEPQYQQTSTGSDSLVRGILGRFS